MAQKNTGIYTFVNQVKYNVSVVYLYLGEPGEAVEGREKFSADGPDSGWLD